MDVNDQFNPNATSPPRQKASGGDWVGPKINVDTMVKIKKFLSQPRIKNL
jgi:hypothetical protein